MARRQRRPRKTKPHRKGVREAGGRGRGWLNKAINNLPFELHLPGHNFTGPGTKLRQRLDANDRPKSGSKPINRVDETSMKHDICYRDFRDQKGRSNCDRQMLRNLRNIKKPTIRERIDRAVVTPIIWGKHKLGM